MNPDSHYYLAFNIGYPNAYDRSLGRTGSNIMIHGVCSSAGCYSMTDKNVAQIYAFARDAFEGGQRAFQVEAFPFRMTPENMAEHRDNPNIDFWKMLKVGYDYFEITKQPPEVNVCDRKYVFNQQVMDGSPFVATAACPSMKTPENLAGRLRLLREGSTTRPTRSPSPSRRPRPAREAEVARRKQEVMEATRRSQGRGRAAQGDLARRRRPLLLVADLVPARLARMRRASGRRDAPARRPPSTAPATSGHAECGRSGRPARRRRCRRPIRATGRGVDTASAGAEPASTPRTSRSGSSGTARWHDEAGATV